MPYLNPEDKRASDRAYRACNRDTIREYLRAWHLANPEKSVAIRKRYCATPAGRASAIKAARKFYATDAGKIVAQRYAKSARRKETLRQWYANGGDINLRVNGVIRRARERLATIGDVSAIRAIYRRAKELRQWFDVVVDHNIPLSRGGAHAAHNLQIIYRRENSEKSNRLDYVPTLVFA